MPTKGTSVKGVRLPDADWAAIDEEARGLGMTRNELLNRRLRHSRPLARGITKRDENNTNRDELLESSTLPNA